jgi:FkbM family methyltransferase
MVFVGWQLWKRTIGRPVVTTYRPGLRIRVYPDSRSAGLALYTRLPEYNEMLFVERLLVPGDVVIDVGANIGLYSLLAASKVAHGRVIALEPDPKAAARLRENAELNGFRNIEIRVEAAGAETGELRLTSGLDTVNRIVSEDEGTASIRVPVSALDDLVVQGVRLSLVKLDTEGYESLVLAGAARLLRDGAVLAWVVEVNGLGGRYGSDDVTVFETLGKFGYRSYLYDAERMLLRRSDSRDSTSEWNMIFIRDSAEVVRRLGPAGLQAR